MIFRILFITIIIIYNSHTYCQLWRPYHFDFCIEKHLGILIHKCSKRIAKVTNETKNKSTPYNSKNKKKLKANHHDSNHFFCLQMNSLCEDLFLTFLIY